LAVVLVEEQTQTRLEQWPVKPEVLAAVVQQEILLMRQAKTLVLGQPDKAQPVVVVRHEGQVQLTLLVVVAVLVVLALLELFITTQVVLEHFLAESLETVVMGVNCLLAVLLQLMAAAVAVVWVELVLFIQQALELAAQAAAATVEWQPLELLVLQTPAGAAEAAVLTVTHLPVLAAAMAAAAS
jgi:hypothetical protein